MKKKSAKIDLGWVIVSFWSRRLIKWNGDDDGGGFYY